MSARTQAFLTWRRMSDHEVIEVCPPSWWQIVLVGMNLSPEHPAIVVKRHRKDVPDNWRGQRTGKGLMKARDFDNALRAGQREITEARIRMTPGMKLDTWEAKCRASAYEREVQLCEWMASWNVAPYLVRPHSHNWQLDHSLLQDLLRLGVEPECWEYDDEAMDRVPLPGFARKQAA